MNEKEIFGNVVIMWYPSCILNSSVGCCQSLSKACDFQINLFLVADSLEFVLQFVNEKLKLLLDLDSYLLQLLNLNSFM